MLRVRTRRGCEYSATELALKREGIAGVCGVCGEIGFPGDDDVEIDVAATMGGTLDSCRLEEVDDRCKSIDEVNDSVRMLCDSRIDWNLVNCDVVRLVAASLPPCWKLGKFLLLSRTLRKSEMLSSSVCKDPELPAVASANIPDPGCAEDDDRLCFPLLP